LQRLVWDWINASFSGCSNLKMYLLKIRKTLLVFYVGYEIIPLISRVEHRPRVCVSHKPSINGLYSIIHVLPKMHASVLNSGLCTIIYMFWPTMSFSGRQNTRMSTSVEVSEPINVYNITFFWCRIILEIALDHDFFDNFSVSYLSMNTLHFFCHYEPFLRPLYIALPGKWVSRNSCNKVANRVTVRKSSRRELILCTVSVMLLVWYKPVTVRWVQPVLHIEGGEKCIYSFWS